MSADEDRARVDTLERRFSELNATIERALSGRNGGSSGDVERQTRRLEDDFTADELTMVRDHREYESFKRNVERYGAELEREAALAQRGTAGDDDVDVDDDDAGDADDDDADDDDDDDASKDAPGGKGKTKAKPKPGDKKPPARRKPPARHAKPDDKDDDLGDDDRPGLLQRLMAD